MDVFEFYDGYEHLWEEQSEEERIRVQYFVIGDIDEHRVGICYIGEYNFIAIIGKNTHSYAWKKGQITKEEACKCLRRSFNKRGPSLDDYKQKYKQITENPPPEIKQLPGHATGQSDSYWGISVLWDHTESYNAKLAIELQKKIKLFELREEFLETFAT